MGGEGGLVGEVVLAGFHATDTQRATEIGDGGGGNELDVFVFEHLGFRFGDLGAVLIGHVLGALGVGVVDPLECRTGIDQATDLTVNVAMIQSHGSDLEFAFFDDGFG